MAETSQCLSKILEAANATPENLTVAMLVYNKNIHVDMQVCAYAHTHTIATHVNSVHALAV